MGTVRKYYQIYLLLIPAIFFLVIVNYVPMAGVVLAFKDYKHNLGIFGSPWAGLRYFREAFRSPDFFRITWNTVKISFVKLLFGFPAPIIFALILNEVRHMGSKRVFQTISYLPHFVSWVVVAGLIRDLLGQFGPVNIMLQSLGQDSVIFLQQESMFVPILVISAIWKNIGWGSIIYLAAIAGIDPQLYEAARMDGLSRLQRMWYITIPSILHVILILLLLRVGHILNAGFEQVFNLYNPIVYSVGDIIDTFVYRVGLLSGFRFSFATAIGLMKNVTGVLLLITVNQVTKRIRQAEGTI
jgi:putative aldouronate transport system permease protein